MSRSRSSVKRLRQSVVARLRNRGVRGAVRSLVKIVEKGVTKNLDKNSVQESMRLAAKALDTAARKGVFKKNTIARKKSRLQLKINRLTISASS